MSVVSVVVAEEVPQSKTTRQEHESLPTTPTHDPKKRSLQFELPFRGVRRRSWGRYVSEIRLPKKKTRIWLGSFVSPEMAARAYDSAALFLKGNSAKLNFPESASSLPRPKSASRKDIQVAAAKAAVNSLSPCNRVESEESESGVSLSSEKWWELDEELMSLCEEVKVTPLTF